MIHRLYTELDNSTQWGVRHTKAQVTWAASAGHKSYTSPGDCIGRQKSHGPQIVGWSLIN